MLVFLVLRADYAALIIAGGSVTAMRWSLCAGFITGARKNAFLRDAKSAFMHMGFAKIITHRKNAKMIQLNKRSEIWHMRNARGLNKKI
jgi:hypothetical protein